MKLLFGPPKKNRGRSGFEGRVFFCPEDPCMVCLPDFHDVPFYFKVAFFYGFKHPDPC